MTIAPSCEAPLIGLDVGGSGVRAYAFTPAGEPIGAASVPLATRHPRRGWAEQSAEDWTGGALAALALLRRRLGPAPPAAIGLSGQCPTCTLIDGAGRAHAPGITYQDNRATTEADRIARLLGAARIRARTGQVPSHFQAAPKLLWLAERMPAPCRGGLHLAQPRDLVARALTGVLATDPTHAGCTGLYDPHAGIWVRDWVAAIGLEWLGLPPILAPETIVGGLTAEAAAATGFPAAVPVCIGAADNFCADLAMGAVAPGVLGDTSGTSTCLDLTLDRPDPAPSLSLYRHFRPHLYFANTGLNATGATLAWAAAALAGGDLGRLEAMAAAAPPAPDAPLLLPYLGQGDRADAGLSGTWYGLALSHGGDALARSVYEGLTFALRELVDGYRATGHPIREARLAGGGSRSAFWRGLKADIWDLPVRAATVPDATALGAALLAGLSAGIYADLEAALAAARVGPECPPDRSLGDVYAERYARWQRLRAGMR